MHKKFWPAPYGRQAYYSGSAPLPPAGSAASRCHSRWGRLSRSCDRGYQEGWHGITGFALLFDSSQGRKDDKGSGAAPYDPAHPVPLAEAAGGETGNKTLSPQPTPASSHRGRQAAPAPGIGDCGTGRQDPSGIFAESGRPVRSNCHRLRGSPEHGLSLPANHFLPQVPPPRCASAYTVPVPMT